MRLPRWLAPVVTAAIAALAVLALTPDGAGLSNDSVSYVGAAIDLREHGTLTTPFTNPLDPVTPAEAAAVDGHVPLVLWPPAYPVALAAAPVRDPDWSQVGRLLDAAAIAITAAATSTLARRAAGGREVAAWLAPAVALASAPVLQLHQFLLSEPLLLAVQALALVVLCDQLEDPRRARLAALAALVAAAPLVRLTGIAVGLVSVGALAAWGSGDRRTRTAAAAGVGAAAVLPVSAWGLWTRGRTATPVREVTWEPLARVRYEEAIERGIEWLVPAPAPTWLRAAILAVPVVLLVWSVRRFVTRRSARSPRSDAHASIGSADRVLLLVGALAAVHTAVAVLGATVVPDEVPIAGRVLTPSWIPLATALVAVGVRAGIAVARSERRSARVAARSAVGATLVVVALLGLDAHDQLAGSELAWEAPEATDAGEVLVSSAPAADWLARGEPVLVTPRRWLDGRGHPNPRLDQEVAELRALAACGSVVVRLHPGTELFTPYLLPADDVRAALVDLQPVEVEVDGVTELRFDAVGAACTGPT